MWELGSRNLTRNYKDMTQGYHCTIDFDGNFQVKYKEPKVKYVEIEIGQLKAGDIFSFKSAYDKLETNFRVVDKEDYKKVFGEYYPYAKSSDSILAYCILEKRFTHFHKKDAVKIQRKSIAICNLVAGTDFEYEDGIYNYLGKSDDYKYMRCVRLDKKMSEHNRERTFYKDCLVYPLD